MAQPAPRITPFHKGLQDIKRKIDKVIEQMEKKPNFIPERSDLDAISAEAVDLIQKHHPQISPNQKSLLTAVIDLSEVPTMHPSMQKVAVQTALKDASRNINDYLGQY